MSRGFGARASRLLVALLAALVFPASAASRDDVPDDAAFRAHLELAIRSPADFGFTDSDEARHATLGWSYPYYMLEEWRVLSARSPGGVDVDDHPPARRLTEVLGAAATVRCVWIRMRGPGGAGVLGLKNLSSGLALLSDRADRRQLVLVMDGATRRLHVADRRKPEQIKTLETLQ